MTLKKKVVMKNIVREFQPIAFASDDSSSLLSD